MGWLRIREIAESVRRRFAPIERPDPVLAMAQKRVVLRSMIRIYIAGASREPVRVRAWITAAQRAGWHVTLDWLAAIEAVGTANEGLSHDDRERYAADDWRAVRSADVVWVLAPEQPSIGCWVEMGLALASGHAHVVVSGPARERTIFGALAEEHTTDAAAFMALVQRFGAAR